MESHSPLTSDAHPRTQGRLFGGGGGAGGGTFAVRVAIWRWDGAVDIDKLTQSPVTTNCGPLTSTHSPLSTGPRWRSAKTPWRPAPFTDASRSVVYVVDRLDSPPKAMRHLPDQWHGVYPDRWPPSSIATTVSFLGGSPPEGPRGGGEGRGEGEDSGAGVLRPRERAEVSLGQQNGWCISPNGTVSSRCCISQHVPAAPPATRCGSWPASSCSARRSFPLNHRTHLLVLMSWRERRLVMRIQRHQWQTHGLLLVMVIQNPGQWRRCSTRRSTR